MTIVGKRTRTPTVLVVDDAPLDRTLASTILNKEDVHTAFAENGREALAFLAAQRPDVVLTDLQMPEMDGLTLVREVKRRYPSIPVILMTGQGSEEIAAQALRTGAASYVPKRNLAQDLANVLATVLAATESIREREQVHSFLTQVDFSYVLGYEPGAAKILVNHLQEFLAQMNICDEIGRLRVGTALIEAVVNAIDHGNLELDSKLREQGSEYRQLGQRRTQLAPYCHRRVFVSASLNHDVARFVIRDEGPGFDPSRLPDPTDPEYLTRPSGRGVMLIRTFMDEVHFNQRGNEITLVKRRQAVN